MSATKYQVYPEEFSVYIDPFYRMTDMTKKLCPTPQMFQFDKCKINIPSKGFTF